MCVSPLRGLLDPAWTLVFPDISQVFGASSCSALVFLRSMLSLLPSRGSICPTYPACWYCWYPGILGQVTFPVPQIRNWYWKSMTFYYLDVFCLYWPICFRRSSLYMGFWNWEAVHKQSPQSSMVIPHSLVSLGSCRLASLLSLSPCPPLVLPEGSTERARQCWGRSRRGAADSGGLPELPGAGEARGAAKKSALSLVGLGGHR